jgi:hypothetical protein
VPEFETKEIRTETCEQFEVLTATIIRAVVFLVMKSRVPVDVGNMFLRNVGSHVPDT